MDYGRYVREIESQYLSALGLAAAPPTPRLGAAPALQGGHSQLQVLVVAPHPDDECLMGAYALRMQEEWGAEVWVYPYSLGSKLERQSERFSELQAAVAHLGFRLLDPESRGGKPLGQVMQALRPEVVFSPHLDDGHATHIACAQATERAMVQTLDAHPEQTFLWIQTEYWHAMREPNLLIPVSSANVTRLGEALALHRGEVVRNPYHLRLPAWMMDQVRRSERVAGPGGDGKPTWVFGQLYTQVQVSK